MIPPIERPVFVYAIEGSGLIKIGLAADPEQRLRMLQTACPFKLTLLKSCSFETRRRAQMVETFIHQELTEQGQHRHGEWFAREPWDPIDCLEFYHETDVKMIAEREQRLRDDPVLSALVKQMRQAGINVKRARS